MSELTEYFKIAGIMIGGALVVVFLLAVAIGYAIGVLV
jgi:hypothetical protein